MNILIIHDSEYGNTNKIAQALVRGAGSDDHVELMHVKDASAAKIKGYDTLIVGSPTQGGRPTQNIQNFIESLPKSSLRDMYISAFDTRFAMEEHGRGLRFLMRTIGFAAPKIARMLQAKGGNLISEPMGFIVRDKTGPLRDGEIEKATTWMKSMTAESVVR